MKKIKLITGLAAVCVLTAGMLSFAACSSSVDSEEVDAEGWASAMDISNFYNFTMEGTASSSDYSGTFTDKVAFATDSEGYITEGYYYGYYSYSDGESGTVYEEMLSGSVFTRLIKTADGGWRTSVDTTAVNSTLFDSYACGDYYDYGMGYYLISDIEDMYLSFTYNGSAYVCDDGGMAYTVKINGGKVSYIKITYSDSTIEANFTSYGTTTVSLPSDVQEKLS